MKLGMLDSYTSPDSEAFFVESMRTYMIDTGYKNGFTDLQQFTSKLSTAPLDVLVISHGDDDHCSAFVDVVRQYAPKFIVFSPLQLYRHVLIHALPSRIISSINRTKLSSKLASIFTSDNYKLKRVVSTAVANSNQQLESTQGELGDFEDFAKILHDPIVIRESDNPSLDVIVAIRRDAGSAIEDDSVIEEGRTTEDDTAIVREITDIFRDIDEFETYDTGQTAAIANHLLTLIRTLSGTGSLRKLAEKIRNSGFIQNTPHTFRMMKKNKSHFLRFFKNTVLEKIKNAMSLITRIRNAIFTGDSTKPHLKSVGDYIYAHRSGNKWFIKVSHHASIHNHSEDFYKTLKPTTLLVSRSTKVNESGVLSYLKASVKKKWLISTRRGKGTTSSPVGMQLIGHCIEFVPETHRIRRFVF